MKGILDMTDSKKPISDSITCPWCGGVTRPVLKENGKYECDRCKRETSE